MESDEKLRVVLVLVSAAVSVMAAIVAGHGIFLPLDGIGGTGH